MAYATSNKRRAWLKEYRSRPDVKLRLAESKKRYRDKQETKEKERAYGREYYKKHRDKRLAYSKWYGAENRDGINKKAREYKQANKDKIRKYRLDNLEKHAEYQRNYRNKNPEVVLAHQVVRTLKEQGKISPQSCEICGERDTEAHHDDYTKPDKIRWLCKVCHMEWHRFNKAKH